ncbi:MAG: cysteine hydrolase family protein, partial [Nitrososphaerales archaeon]
MVDQSSDSRDNPGPDEIPQPEAIELPVRNSALVIVDMQNDFVQATGKIYTGSMVNATVPRIRELLDRARQAQMKVIHTQSWYERDDPRFTDHAKARFYKGGCMAGTWGAELINELKPLDKEPVVRKASYDCWYGTNMELVLKAMKFGEFEPGSVHRNRERNNFNVVITGTVSNVCVEKAVIGFYL